MRLVLLFAAGLLLTACSSPAPPPARAPQAAASTRHAKTPWDGLIQAENKARSVQGIINKRAKAQQQAIEKQTR